MLVFGLHGNFTGWWMKATPSLSHSPPCAGLPSLYGSTWLQSLLFEVADASARLLLFLVGNVVANLSSQGDRSLELYVSFYC